MHTLTGALASLVVGIAAALVIVAIAILPFLTPAWVGFEQGRAQAAAWTGYSEARPPDRHRRDPGRPRASGRPTSTSRSPGCPS